MGERATSCRVSYGVAAERMKMQVEQKIAASQGALDFQAGWKQILPLIHRSLPSVLLWGRAKGRWFSFGLYWAVRSINLGYVHLCLSQDTLLSDCGWVPHTYESRSKFTGWHQRTPKNIANLIAYPCFCRRNLKCNNVPSSKLFN